VEKLREHFHRRGVATSAGIVTVALGVAGSQLAPTGLAAAVATASLAAVGTAGTVGIIHTLTLMKTKLILATIAVAAVATPITIQQQKLSRLRAENQTLHQAADQAVGLQAENERLSKQKVDADELARLRAEQPELMRLRAEVARLRQQTAQQQAMLATRPPVVVAPVANPPSVATEDQLKQQATNAAIVNAMKQLGLAARIFAQDNNDTMPTNFDQMKAELPPQFSGGVTLDQFEFMPQSGPVTDRQPNTILFRERVPRQTPDGQWVRCYTLVDGSVQQATSQTPDFSAWEAPHLATAAAGQGNR
jgi:Ni/Co efflux regulator RcnB